MGQESTTTETTAPTSDTTASETSTTSEAPATTASSTSETTAATGTTLSADEEREKERDKARAKANLNLAKAADEEIAAQLQTITMSANETLEKIEAARKQIEVAEAIAVRTEEQLRDSGARQAEIEASLRIKAVEGFKSQSLGDSAMLFTGTDLNQAIRQSQLLAQANLSTTDLLGELRALVEDRREANLQADLAKTDAERAEKALQAELEKLKEQQSEQLGLKSEAERRIDIWAGELTAYAKEDAAVQELIAKDAQPTQVDTAINNPITPSTLGFQWPINARATSEFGYRTHPIYGSRRLHAGIDLGAAGGTPIAASNDGVVIFSGTQGGYGRTVIVDHGGGITTLYAHQSKIIVSKGESVSRGQIIGHVGSTGNSTGNHLHLEVRVNGTPNNPRDFLP